MCSTFARLWRSRQSENGQSMVEYAMLLSFVAMGVFLVLGLLGRQVAGMLQPITDGLKSITGIG